MMETIAGVGMICIAISAVYFLKNRKQPEEKYIWVGQGKDPFKKD